MTLLSKCAFGWPASWWKNLYAINLTKGCEFDCGYCWAKDMAKRFPNMRPSSGEWDKPELASFCRDYKTDSFTALTEVLSTTTSPLTILLSATCDPYQDIARPLTQIALREVLAYRKWGGHPHHALILTKSPDVVKDLSLLKELDAEVGFTIVPSSPLGKAPTDAERLDALYSLQGFGIRTFISFEPWWPGVDVDALVEIMYEAWVVRDRRTRFILGSLNKNGRPVNPDFYRREWPKLKEWLDAQGLVEEQGQGTGNYWLKPELKKLLVAQRRKNVAASAIGGQMKGKIDGFLFTTSRAEILLTFPGGDGRRRELRISLVPHRTLTEADILEAIKGEMENLELIHKRLSIVKELLGTEVDLPDFLL